VADLPVASQRGAAFGAARRPGSEARDENRITVWLKGATLRERGCSAAPVIIHDLSISGFRTEWPYNLRVGDLIWLKLPGFEAMPSIVAWNANFQVGCRFQAPLHPAVFERIVQACNRQQS
jgi:hypothetical protein